MKNIKKILVALVLTTFSYVNAQVNSNRPVNNGITDQNLFFDAATNFNDANSIGKGLGFPRTDLTTWTFDVSALDGINFPTAFDGMVVYNTASGNTILGQGIVTTVKPGFYYFSNLSGSNDIASGQWLPVASGSALLSGTTAPTNGVGADGDFYIDSTSGTFYGPKVAGAWPAGSSLTGPAGPAGPAGPQGTPGTNGLLPNGTQAGNTTFWNGTNWVVDNAGIFNTGSVVGIGTTSPNASAILDVASTTKGFLPPRMTGVQMNAISSPAEGLIIYCTDCNPKGIYNYNGTSWDAVGGTATPLVSAACGGFSGSYCTDTLNGTTYQVTMTNNDFSSKQVTPQTSDLILTGLTGVTVSAVSPNTLQTVNAGASLVITYTLNGTPSSQGTLTGVFNKQGLTCTSTIQVLAPKSAAAASSTPSLCISTPLTAITHTTSGSTTGIGTATNLPTGVTASWASNTITISGTPTVSGTFNYSIPLLGCGSAVSASGTITVSPDMTASAPSSTASVSIAVPMPIRTHTTVGATGIGVATGLPAGVTAAWASNTITISGTPSVLGSFPYTIPLVGPCGNVNASGTITVTNPGDATFDPVVTAYVVSINDNPPPVNIQGVVDNGGNTIVVPMNYTNGSGTYAAYTSSFVINTPGSGEAGDSNSFRISYSAGTFASSGTINVTIQVDGDGTFNATRQLFSVSQIIAAMNFQVNLQNKSTINLTAIGGEINKNFLWSGNGAKPAGMTTTNYADIVPTAFYGPVRYAPEYGDCNVSWRTAGLFCYDNSSQKTRPTAKSTHAAITWTISGVPQNDNGNAYIVVDLGEVRVFNTMYAHQTNSDGRFTSIEISVASSALAGTDPGWTVVKPAVANEVGCSFDPAGYRFPFPAQVARYVRLRASNSGVCGSASFIEIFGAGLFLE
jgi:hypothetical protein